MLGRDTGLLPPTLSMSQDARPFKRLRADGRETQTDRFDFVSQQRYELGPTDPAVPEGAKRLYSKKQPLSCAECRRLKLKVRKKSYSSTLSLTQWRIVVQGEISFRFRDPYS
jgi:hypothetical protein